jgi:mannose-6-phosphate isomerase-like protein (cupin superfamily)
MRAADVTISEFQGQPQISTAEERSWIIRAANFVVRLTRALPGTRLACRAGPDEYFVLLPETGAAVSAGGRTLEAQPGTLLIVPPGDSDIVARGSGLIVSVFSAESADLVRAASNHEGFDGSLVAPPVSWPMPVDGYRLRTYRLDDYNRPDTLMRLFRTRKLMINVFRPRQAPRDTAKLSPHSHADFEQGSLCLLGSWSHHVRYPWTPDMSEWRPDREFKVGSPSLTVIPPTVIHTSRNTSEGASWLVDIFAPPREDFSRRPGLVNNSDEYPVPPEIAILPELAKAE